MVWVRKAVPESKHPAIWPAQRDNLTAPINNSASGVQMQPSIILTASAGLGGVRMCFEAEPFTTHSNGGFCPPPVGDLDNSSGEGAIKTVTAPSNGGKQPPLVRQ